MTWWLHAVVIYPLAAFGGAVALGLGVILTDWRWPGARDRYCAGCGVADPPRESAHGYGLCDACAGRR